MRSPTPLASAEDRAACRAMIQGGSKTFYAASHLLPARLREDAYALYAFCRLSDDLVDIDGGKSAAIAKLRQRLSLAYAGRPEDAPVDRAFADVVARHRLPRALPLALIDGLAWDVTGVRCEDLDDVFAYAARVAGSVGAMMAVLMGVRDPDRLARACDLGVAMQLTNIARDVGEDARNGRLYLPRLWLREAGMDPDAWLANPAPSAALGSVIARLLATADSLYARADAGIAGLPFAYRPGIFAARHVYHRIGVEVACNGFDSVTVRARVSLAGKIALIARSLVAAAVPLSGATDARYAPALPQTAYLVDAVVQSSPLAVRPPRLSERLSDRLVWVAQLFADLETRKRSAVMARAADAPA